MSELSAEKLEKLRALVRSYGSCVIGYSGGVDSTFLSYIAVEELGQHVLCVLVDSPLMARREIVQAIENARKLNLPLCVVRLNELERSEIAANHPDRCYHCKLLRYSTLKQIAEKENYAFVLDGTTGSDAGQYRPGALALKELGIKTPMQEVDLNKEEIRQLSAAFGLPTAEKPAAPCLATRLPYGQPLEPEILAMIERAEAVLFDIGCSNFRVRHHTVGVEVPGRNTGKSDGQEKRPIRSVHLARIELEAPDLDRIWREGLVRKISSALHEIGYTWVTVDLGGYRQGSFDLGAA